jgi:hypothetical protein
MSRLCLCENQRPGAYTLDQCRLCWLYHHDRVYRSLWHARPCRHLGAATGATSACPSCQGTVALKLFACALHQCCTQARPVADLACCASCSDREPPATDLAL